MTKDSIHISIPIKGGEEIQGFEKKVPSTK